MRQNIFQTHLYLTLDADMARHALALAALGLSVGCVDRELARNEYASSVRVENQIN
jgi:hypothetical protein